MQYCPKCRISVRGNKACCPLCQGPLTGEPEPGAFPVTQQNMESKLSLFFKIITFLLILIEISLAAVNYLTGRSLPGVSLAMLIAPVVWADLWVATYFRNNVIKMLTTELYIAMLICLIADLRTGFHGWSVAWVIPLVFVFMAILTVALGMIVKLTLETYIIYLFFIVLLSLLQMIPLALGVNPFPIPAVLCMAALVVFGSGGVIFRSRELLSASRKWFSL